MMRTWPWWSSRTFSGTSRPWASPASWAQGQAVGHLGDDPRGAAGLQRAVVGQHDVERGPLAPLVDDVAEVVELLGVQHAQQPGVEVGGDVAGRLEQPGGARVVARDEVDRHVPVQDRVVGAPEAAALALGEQVVEAVARGEDLAGVDRVRHRSPRSRWLPAGRWTTHIVGLTVARSRPATLSTREVTSRIRISRAAREQDQSARQSGEPAAQQRQQDPRLLAQPGQRLLDRPGRQRRRGRTPAAIRTRKRTSAGVCRPPRVRRSTA